LSIRFISKFFNHKTIWNLNLVNLCKQENAFLSQEWSKLKVNTSVPRDSIHNNSKSLLTKTTWKLPNLKLHIASVMQNISSKKAFSSKICFVNPFTYNMFNVVWSWQLSQMVLEVFPWGGFPFFGNILNTCNEMVTDWRFALICLLCNKKRSRRFCHTTCEWIYQS